MYCRGVSTDDFQFHSPLSIRADRYLGMMVVQDFYNLVDVYLDAVFFPNCLKDPNTFLQEGWHYELNNPSENITFKGTFRPASPVPYGVPV